MRKLIIDCDNTFSVRGCDIDDGLAIIYALANMDVEILGISTTFGNNELEVVYPNTLSFMESIGFPDIPVLKGSKHSHRDNEAAEFIVKMADRYGKELSILAIGSLTNLFHAWEIDASIYEKVGQISIMGGVTEPLIINGKELGELNLSCDHLAALNVFDNGKSILLATGNTCLDGYFSRRGFEELAKGNEFERWLYEKSLYWFDRESEVFGNEGIFAWDIMAAAALLNPHLFELNKAKITPDEESLKNGFLFGDGEEREVVIPKVKKVDDYIDHVYEKFSLFGE